MPKFWVLLMLIVHNGAETPKNDQVLTAYFPSKSVCEDFAGILNDQLSYIMGDENRFVCQERNGNLP